MPGTADIARTDSYNLRKEIQNIRPSKKHIRQLGRGNLAGVMTGEGILQGMKEQDEKDAEKQATRAAKAAAKAAKPPVTPHVVVAKKRHVRFEHDGIPSTVPRYRQQSVFSITSDASSTDWHYHPQPTAIRRGPARTTPTPDSPVTIDSSPLSSPPPSPTPLVRSELYLWK
ncbi:hypothetical protein BDD12DRAFT_890588 [Trichophaea hybrida]|nr:hypothetical protein BDD12DRAFT_890588 [Trichophaea hybrida]